MAVPVRGLRFVAPTSESMLGLVLFQIQVDEGPCVDSYRNGEAIVKLSRGEINGRWPRFTSRVLLISFRSVPSDPLRLRGRTIGVLNLFRMLQGPKGEEDVAVTRGLAEVATIAILQHRSSLDASTLNEQLSKALGSRIIVAIADSHGIQ